MLTQDDLHYKSLSTTFKALCRFVTRSSFYVKDQEEALKYMHIYCSCPDLYDWVESTDHTTARPTLEHLLEVAEKCDTYAETQEAIAQLDKEYWDKVYGRI